MFLHNPICYFYNTVNYFYRKQHSLHKVPSCRQLGPFSPFIIYSKQLCPIVSFKEIPCNFFLSLSADVKMFLVISAYSSPLHRLLSSSGCHIYTFLFLPILHSVIQRSIIMANNHSQEKPECPKFTHFSFKVTQTKCQQQNLQLTLPSVKSTGQRLDLHRKGMKWTQQTELIRCEDHWERSCNCILIMASPPTPSSSSHQYTLNKFVVPFTVPGSFHFWALLRSLQLLSKFNWEKWIMNSEREKRTLATSSRQFLILVHSNTHHLFPSDFLFNEWIHWSDAGDCVSCYVMCLLLPKLPYAFIECIEHNNITGCLLWSSHHHHCSSLFRFILAFFLVQPILRT